MITFLIITGIVIAVFIAMNLIKIKPKEKPKSIMDVLNEDPEFQKMKKLFDVMSELNEGGTDQDTIPDGYGEFGHDLTNPIPVNTVFGNRAYLGMLRTLDGRKVEYERLGSTSTPNIEDLIDIYRISIDGKEIATLYISPSNKKNSERPPRGFKLSTLLQ